MTPLEAPAELPPTAHAAALLAGGEEAPRSDEAPRSRAPGAGWMSAPAAEDGAEGGSSAAGAPTQGGGGRWAGGGGGAARGGAAPPRATSRASSGSASDEEFMGGALKGWDPASGIAPKSSGGLLAQGSSREGEGGGAAAAQPSAERWKSLKSDAATSSRFAPQWGGRGGQGAFSFPA